MIGENQGYQQYLVTIEQIKVGGEVGKELVEKFTGTPKTS